MAEHETNGAPEGTGVATQPPTEGGLAWFYLAIGLVLSVGLVRALTDAYVLDIDPSNLVYGMGRFDIEQHAPHPPGYLAYIMCLRVLHVLRGGDASLADRFATVQWLALLFHVLTIGTIFAAMRRAMPEHPLRAGFAAMVIALSPFLLFHAVDAQTHDAESFASALLLLLLVRRDVSPTAGSAIALGLGLALGASFRPTFVVTGVLPVVLSCRKRPAHLVLAGATSVVGALGFILPTLAMSGGYETWNRAHHALVQGVFMKNASLLSDAGVPEFQRFQLLTTVTWILALALPFALCWAFVVWRRHMDPPVAPVPPEDELVAYAVAACIPSVIFYLLVFCSEPGYLNGVIPFVVAATLARFPHGWDIRRTSYAAGVLVFSELVMFLTPVTLAPGIKQPELRQIIDIDLRTGLWLEAVRQYAPRGRVLVVSDFADLSLARQLPMQEPRAHMLSFYATPRIIFPRTMAGFLTEDAWLPIPGPAHLIAGPPKIVDVPYAYDVVLVDAATSTRARQRIFAHVACQIPMRKPGRFVAIPAHCFPDRTVELDGQGVRFRSTVQ